MAIFRAQAASAAMQTYGKEGLCFVARIAWFPENLSCSHESWE
jgi:hypothetical protein